MWISPKKWKLLEKRITDLECLALARSGEGGVEKESKMSDKEYDILNKAEDVILKKIEQYEGHTHEMSDKDCYALQLLVITAGRILSIKKGINREAPY